MTQADETTSTSTDAAPEAPAADLAPNASEATPTPATTLAERVAAEEQQIVGELEHLKEAIFPADADAATPPADVQPDAPAAPSPPPDPTDGAPPPPSAEPDAAPSSESAPSVVPAPETEPDAAPPSLDPCAHCGAALVETADGVAHCAQCGCDWDGATLHTRGEPCARGPWWGIFAAAGA